MKRKILFILFPGLLLLSCGGTSTPDNNSTNSKEDKTTSGSSSLTGEQLYTKHCTPCHGSDGTMGVAGAKKIPESALTQIERESLISTGKNTMPSFSGKMNADEIKRVAEYSFTLK